MIVTAAKHTTKFADKNSSQPARRNLKWLSSGPALLMLNAKLLALNVALIVLVAVFSAPFLLLF
ncbi:MAG TPA: hypothetical protein VL907_12475, partial [Pyrinomonadaceae bacterium]|nr:hypothetical protein [Pyrinomonadaceae bacterium]